MRKCIKFGNAKLKEDGTGSFSLPAVTTCPYAGECKNWCYVQSGFFKFSAVVESYEYNYERSKQLDFVDTMIAEIGSYRRDVRQIRIHASGDFYNRRYLKRWYKIMEAFPDKVFYAYTKSFRLIDYNDMPENFIPIQSEGGIDKVDKTRKHAVVFESLGALESAGYTHCPDHSELMVLEADVIKIGLVIHGEQKSKFKA